MEDIGKEPIKIGFTRVVLLKNKGFETEFLHFTIEEL